MCQLQFHLVWNHCLLPCFQNLRESFRRLRSSQSPYCKHSGDSQNVTRDSINLLGCMNRKFENCNFICQRLYAISDIVLQQEAHIWFHFFSLSSNILTFILYSAPREVGHFSLTLCLYLKCISNVSEMTSEDLDFHDRTLLPSLKTNQILLLLGFALMKLVDETSCNWIFAEYILQEITIYYFVMD